MNGRTITSSLGGWSVGALFRRRVRRFWREQWKAWRTALDWTVWLYLVLPVLWIGGGTYLDAWHHPAAWLQQIPMTTGERLPLVVLFLGRLRTFVEDADVLFLLQKRSWGRGLLLRGMAYTALVLLMMPAIAFGLLLPYFVKVHHLPASSLAGMIAVVWLWAFIGAVWRNLIEARMSGLRRWLAKTGAMLLLVVAYFAFLGEVGTSPAELLVPIAVGIVVAAIAIRAKLAARDAFESDAQQETLARLASTQLLLRNVTERKPRIKLIRPIVFAKSNRLFKRFDGGTVLAEMILKSFIRRFPLVRTWLGFTGICVVALLLSPAVLKPYEMLAFMLLLSSWFITHWRGMTAEPYVAQFGWSDYALKQSAGRVRFWLGAPVAGIFGLASGLQTYGPWGALAVVPCVAAWLLVSKLVTSMMILRTGD